MLKGPRELRKLDGLSINRGEKETPKPSHSNGVVAYRLLQIGSRMVPWKHLITTVKVAGHGQAIQISPVSLCITICC